MLLLLTGAQFLMTLDSSVMNVSIAYVAEDLDTTVTGIQSAITLYTLVMASLMITGGRIGGMIGRRRAFVLGLIIYSTGSLVTAFAPSLPVLLLGWSLLEGIGAALIMPAVVALVASNFPPARRTAAYGAIAAAAALAIAAGPLIGGAVTTVLSWRLVFIGEVVVGLGILVLARRLADVRPGPQPRFDFVGMLLSIVGLASFVLGVLRSSEWGWIMPVPGGPQVLGVAPTIWLLLIGLTVLWLLTRYESRLEEAGGEPLIRPSLFRVPQLSGGLALFLGQYFISGGIFFVIPLFLSVVMGLTAFETGVRLVPLSLALLAAAITIPRVWPRTSPRRIVQAGLFLCLAGVLVLMGGINLDGDPATVALPMLLLGAGMGALASQLGAITVSAVPDDLSPDVGGLQYTASNLGTSLGTALVGSVLIGVLSSAFVSGILASPDIPEEVKQQAGTELAGGIPFISDAQLEEALLANGVDAATTAEIVDENFAAQIAGLRAALGVVALVAVVALFITPRIPDVPPGAQAGQGDSLEEGVPAS
ncbi:MAG TPA: MFS transporter [Candidatus Limnocylindrales bacterium]|nr:MFS transporter [Candidatus Limnocylindrales bacterium]